MPAECMRRRAAFSLTELLVVIAIVAVLLGLLVAGVQKARVAALRVVCVNNLKQTGLAIHYYIQVNGHYPSGGTPSPKRGWGHSWQALILPFLDLNSQFRQFDYKAEYPGSPHTGVVYGPNPLGIPGNLHNGNLVKGQDIRYFFCPMSPLPKWVGSDFTPPGPIGVLSPTYTAVNGAADHPSVLNLDANPWAAFGDTTGKLSFGGVLPMRTHVRAADITDGPANTIMVGEQSGWLLSPTGEKMDGRSDFSLGFVQGPTAQPDWLGYSIDHRHFNGTTVRYRINDRAWNQTGVGPFGANRPIQSIHPGGANVLMADGSVHFLRETIDLQVLFNLANRDDGNRSSVP